MQLCVRVRACACVRVCGCACVCPCMGMYPSPIQACFLPLTDASSFVALYIVTSIYFSGVMVSAVLLVALH